MQNIIFNIRDNSLTEETKIYITEKLAKLTSFIHEAEEITVNIVETKAHLSKFKDLDIEILIRLPKAFVKVEDKGHNVNVLIDKMVPILLRRLKRYNNSKDRWLKQAEWKAQAIEKSVSVDDAAKDIHEETLNFEPYIKKKFYTDDTPIHPAEAVERMELLGHTSFLFKNIETNRYAMLYRRDKGGYGLVEAKL